jgi:hypothetical protein
MDSEEIENQGCLLGCGIGYTLFLLYKFWQTSKVTEEILDKILPGFEYL